MALTAHIMCSVSLRFEDRDGNHSSTMLWFPFGLPTASIKAAMDIIIPKINAISDAYIASWQIRWSLEDDSPSSAGSDSELNRKMVLYYSKDGIFDRLIVPSARLDLMETTGTYAGVRLDAGRPEVAAILDPGMADLVEQLLTPEGDAFPTDFVVGGITY